MSIAPELLHQCWFLAGPTACGKTATAIELAKSIDAEILSLDSMAIYRDMDIGTAKPTAQEQSQIPHHLINLINPEEEYSLSQYMDRAAEVVQDILARNKTPLFAGGTGLYLRSILRGVFEGPPADWDFRNRAEQQELETPGYLHAELLKCDPPSAKRLHPNDQRRVIRALEVFHQTGKQFSAQQQQPELPPEYRPAKVFWLHPNRPWLYARINRRVDLMLEQGLIEEVTELLQRDPPPGRTAVQGLGYKEIIEHLRDGVPLEQTIVTLKTRTRQFAKRQHTWFRNLSECQEIMVDGTETATALAKRIEQA
ncbi:MAG: tRNA (adenosine(37)-N6)-dimethylallyltransferase MiaA [Planctomycetaceae bacterium]|nr:tRNA (adenosine(37)-N6)-dimethylallyltransferase MiaA [Planctomycetaceae bacterium]